MVKANDLCDLFYQAFNEGWGYIWGTYGGEWNESRQRELVKWFEQKYGADWKNTGTGNDRYKSAVYGSKWYGHRVADCSGLGYWAFLQLGGSMAHGSDTMWNQYVTDRSELKGGKRTDGKEVWKGDPVFRKKVKDGVLKRHHVGYYVGDGVVIEAKGAQYGVIKSALSDWHETAHWKGVWYEENGGEVVAYPLLKRGSTGTDVKTLQALLNGWGYQLDVDGNFGAKTETAVRSFQQRMGLKSDGIVGDQTWAALTSAEPDVPDEPEEEYLELVNPKNGQTGKISMSAARELHDALRAAGIR